MEFGKPDWYLINYSITIASVVSSALAAILTILILRTEHWKNFQRRKKQLFLLKILSYLIVFFVSGIFVCSYCSRIANLLVKTILPNRRISQLRRSTR